MNIIFSQLLYALKDASILWPVLIILVHTAVGDGRVLSSWLQLPYNVSYIFCSLQVFCGLCEPICKLKYSGNTTKLIQEFANVSSTYF